MRPRERLLRKDIPKEAIRKELERWSDRLMGWNQFFTAIVVGGLAIEYLPDAASFLGMFSHTLFIVLHSHADPLHQFGGLIVIAGIVGEFSVASRERKVESDLRDESNSEIGILHKRAANAERDAAEANLARVRIERKFKPRKLDPKASEELANSLRVYRGTRIDVFAYDSHVHEVLLLADAIRYTCFKGDCDCRVWFPRGERSMFGESVIVGTARDATPEENDIFSPISMAFARAFECSGIRASFFIGGFSKTATIAPEPAPGSPPWSADDIASYRIQLVEKSLLDSPFHS